MNPSQGTVREFKTGRFAVAMYRVERGGPFVPACGKATHRVQGAAFFFWNAKPSDNSTASLLFSLISIGFRSSSLSLRVFYTTVRQYLETSQTYRRDEQERVAPCG